MIKHVRINQDNLNYALQISKEIFGNTDCRQDYVDFINGENSKSYFLIYDGDNCIGVSGINHFGQDYTNAWLSWFGILPKLRRTELGSNALRLIDETARDLGFRCMRCIVSDDKIYEGSQSFFKCNGYQREDYRTQKDPQSMRKNYYIFSKNLYPEPIDPWNNRTLNVGQMLRGR